MMETTFSNECCEKCKFIRRLKHNFTRGNGFEESYCCVVYEYYRDPIDRAEGWVQEVGLDGMCELFDDGTNNKE